MSNRPANQRGVPVVEAKQLLDRALRHNTKTEVAQRTGLSRYALNRIDFQREPRVEYATVMALKKIAGERV